MKSDQVMKVSPIVPVIAIDDAKDAVPLAKALMAGGINIMEITLRTDAALESIKLVAKELPDMQVGAGTVCNEKDLIDSKNAGAKFVFSPGISKELIEASVENDITLVAGVSTSSEVMMAQNAGLTFCKLFPAVLSGGVDILKAYSGPYSKMNFCPTGGVNLENINSFLSLKNVPCVGGTWIAKKEDISSGNFEKITKLCKEALDSIK